MPKENCFNPLVTILLAFKILYTKLIDQIL